MSDPPGLAQLLLKDRTGVCVCLPVALEQLGEITVGPGTVHSWASMQLGIEPSSALPHSAGNQEHLGVCRLDFTQPVIGGVDPSPDLPQ